MEITTTIVPMYVNTLDYGECAMNDCWCVIMCKSLVVSALYDI